MPHAISNHSANQIESSLNSNAAPGRLNTFQRVACSLGGLLCRSGSRVQVVVGLGNAHPVSQMSQLRLLSNKLLERYGPSRKVQNQLKKQIDRRSHTLGYTEEDPLFVFANNRDDTTQHATRKGDTLIVKPLDDAKLVLSDLYNKKYGIRIAIETRELTAEQLAEKIEHECKNWGSGPVGLIVQAKTFRQHLVGSRELCTGNYQGHVTPLAIQKTEQGIDIVALDGAGCCDFRLVGSKFQLEKNHAQVRLLDQHKIRQADNYSCHTDALQILKDLLLQHANSAGNLIDSWSSQYGSGGHLTSESNLTMQIDLPPFLQKTTQRSDARVSSNYSQEELMQTQLPATQTGKSKTVEQHLQRYTRHTEKNLEKTQNHFLLIKAFHNANKVLDHLESFESDSARQEYLAGLRETFT